jgi:putative transposase
MALSKAWRKVRLQREDYCQKVTTTLAKRYQTIVFERLNIQNMVKNSKLARQIYDATWYKLQVLAAYKAEVRKVNPSGTTQRCSNCGELPKEKIGLDMRVYECWNCGLVMDRDHNAAKNIVRLGLEESLAEKQKVVSMKHETKPRSLGLG